MERVVVVSKALLQLAPAAVIKGLQGSPASIQAPPGGHPWEWGVGQAKPPPPRPSPDPSGRDINDADPELDMDPPVCCAIREFFLCCLPCRPCACATLMQCRAPTLRVFFQGAWSLGRRPRGGGVNGGSPTIPRPPTTYATHHPWTTTHVTHHPWTTTHMQGRPRQSEVQALRD